MAMRIRPFDWHVIKTETCWLFRTRTGKKPRKYAEYRTKEGRILAHRFSWERVNGPIPRGKILHHKCKNKLCVNPDHLELTTYHDHVDAPAVINRNKTHCIRGHEYTPSNTYTNGKPGSRRCVECNSLRNRGLI